ncbi:MAG: peptidylprolyl isomerase [Puniceicoccales bacterium]|jgi:peptidyl-prolyl cis-trans isomerase B (cyclophilin B)|nr:peptidylprolyl isomerase [Puniceicoccales bacterium]
MRHLFLFFSLGLAFAFGGCSKETAKETQPSAQTTTQTPATTPDTSKATPPAAQPTTPPATTPAPSDGKEVAVIKTTEGEMVVEFWPDVAPKTVENFKKLSKEGFYNGTAFHRIIKGFMIQGGCPNSKVGATGTPGTGGPGYNIKAEFNNKSHQRGVLSMARSAHPDSAGSQFFICDGDASFLDNKYTAFGKLIKGDDVLTKIANTPVTGKNGENSSPTKRVEIESVTIVPASSIK